MDLMQMAERQTAYTLELYSGEVTMTKDVYKNIAMSPLSIAIAMAMTAAGARGKTLDQMVSHLKYDDSQTMHQFFLYVNNTVLQDSSSAGGPLLDFANCLLVERTLPLDAAYRLGLKESYGADAESVDFRYGAEYIRLQLNDWVHDKTRGKISELFPPNSVGAGTKLLVANALYFKGDWEHQFSRAGSANIAFHLLNGQCVSVPMMTTGRKQYIRNYGTFKVLKLPYRQGAFNNLHRNFSMYILLPNEMFGLPDLEKQLDTTAAAWLMDQLPSLNESVSVGRFLLPHFYISYGLEASNLLKSMNLALPFAPNADFSGILGTATWNLEPLCLSKVFHKVVVQVNEEGTVAAAATGTAMVFGSRPPAPRRGEDFVADHPFLFLIRDDVTGVVMFIGRVANPLE